ncbi:MAG: hypothetical protein M3Z03_02690 [Actinomycetota bacterium]|nr:hypothetical protein [Actinomycetota bacterium]
MLDGGQERSEDEEALGVFPLDPLAGARFLGEIQAEGLRAAGALVERLVHLVDGPVPKFTPADPAEAPSDTLSATEDAMGAITPWFELWTDLVERTTATMQRVRGTTPDPVDGGVHLEVDGSLLPSHPLTVPVVAGGCTRTEMWLHNGSDDAYDGLAPRCGPLVTADGSTLQGTVHFEPSSIESLPARSSRGFLVEIAIDDGVAPGIYRSTVQVRGASAVWMAIEVVVDAEP